MKTGIILAGFGSTSPSAASALEHMLCWARERHPGLPCLAAGTSGHVRRVLEGSPDQDTATPLPPVEEALTSLVKDGVEAAVIQSLHMAPGKEYHGLLELAQRERRKTEGMQAVEVGFPLLAGEADLDRVARAALAIAPKTRGKKEASILMAHGTLHPGNAFYEGLARRLDRSSARILLGTMDATPGIDDVLERLRDRGVEKAYLLPFLFAVGVHASRDMAGEGQESWQSVLAQAGIRCEPVLRGMGEYPEMASIWLDHMDEALLRLEGGHS